LGLAPKIFGCVAYVHIPKTQRTKVEPCALKCVFLGFGTSQKGYRCFDPVSRKWYVTRDVTFIEHEPFFHDKSYVGQGENMINLGIWSPPQNTENKNFESQNHSTGIIMDHIGVQQPFEPSVEQLVQNESGIEQTWLNESITVRNQTESLTYDEKMPTVEEVADRAEQPECDVQKITQVYTRDKTRKMFGENDVEDDILDDAIEEEMVQTAPQSPGSPEDNTAVSLSHSSFILPLRENRGKKPKRYVPEDGVVWNMVSPIMLLLNTFLRN
jgi:hypothetical protein